MILRCCHFQRNVCCHRACNATPGGTPDAPDYILAALWADSTFDGTTQVTAGTLSSAEQQLPSQCGSSSPAYPDVFVISYRDVIVTVGATDERISFQVQLFKDGRFHIQFDRAHSHPDFAQGRFGSIGYQGRRGSFYSYDINALAISGQISFLGGTGIGFSVAPETAEGLDPFPDLDVPNIVQRWAPDIYVDWSPYSRWDPYPAPFESHCNSSIVDVNFDGDCNKQADNNLSNFFAEIIAGNHPPPVIYYAYAASDTHHFITYMVYHAYDCTRPNWHCDNEHEHDITGYTVAVSKVRNSIDAAFSFAHGDPVPYVAVRRDGDVQISRKLSLGWGSRSTHMTLVPRVHTCNGSSCLYERPAFGIENDTHASWGRWDDRCIIGEGVGGAISGCEWTRGGDGFVLVHGDPSQQQAATVYDQYPRWRRYVYRLKPVQELYALAHSLHPGLCGGPSSRCCGASELYTCENVGYVIAGSTVAPDLYSVLNGAVCDKGNLPWSWGVDPPNLFHGCEVIDPDSPTRLRRPNFFAEPARAFDRWFHWPTSTTLDVPLTSWCYTHFAGQDGPKHLETLCPFRSHQLAGTPASPYCP